MGFSYMKSKLGIIYFNNPLPGQFSEAINQCRLQSPFKRSIQVSKFRMLSSVACLYGLQKINSGLVICTGRRLIHSNNVFNRALTPMPYRQLAGQLAKSRIRSWWRFVRNRKYGITNFSIAFLVLFGSLQCVPYSNRIHLVIRSEKLENFIGWLGFRSRIEKNRGTILSPNCPQSVRVNAILINIVQAMHDSLGLQKDCHVSVLDEYKSEKYDYSIPKAIGSIFFSRNKSINGSHNSGTLPVSRRQMSTSNSLKIAQISPKKLTRRFYGTKHLDGLDWEVMVVKRSYIDNAEYIANGKIMIYTGSLKGTDADIATTLAHEVGHGVGRHHSEILTRAFWYLMFTFMFLLGLPPDGNAKLTEIVFTFFSRRRELEADYIGLMLMAAAGYDPRCAPDTYRRHHHEKERFLDRITSTHPCGEERVKKLEEVMKVAVEIYEQTKANQRITF